MNSFPQFLRAPRFAVLDPLVVKSWGTFVIETTEKIMTNQITDLIPAEALVRLKDNHLVNECAALADEPSVDLRPVVKLFLPTSGAIYSGNRLCGGQRVADDHWPSRHQGGPRTTFIAQKSLNGYAAEARRLGHINA